MTGGGGGVPIETLEVKSGGAEDYLDLQLHKIQISLCSCPTEQEK